MLKIKILKKKKQTKTIQVSFGLPQENRSNIIAHFCTWPGVKFGKTDVYKVQTECCNVPHVTPVISDVFKTE